MVQHVIDSLLHQQPPTWVESAESAVNFTFPGGEQAQSGTQVRLLLPGADSAQLSVYVAPSEATPILCGLDMVRDFGLAIDASLRRRFLLTVIPTLLGANKFARRALVSAPTPLQTQVHDSSRVRWSDASFWACRREGHHKVDVSLE